MNSDDRIKILKLLFGDEAVSMDQMLSSITDSRENVEIFLARLRKMGLISNRNGLYKATTNTNPRVPDRMREKLLIKSKPNRLLGSVTPTTNLPRRQQEPEVVKSKGARGRPRKSTRRSAKEQRQSNQATEANEPEVVKTKGARGRPRKSTRGIKRPRSAKEQGQSNQASEANDQVSKRPRQKVVTFGEHC